MIKLRFHGPPSLFLHHLTALAESGSIKSLVKELIRSQLLDILIARCIAKISALLISIGGIGEEKRQMKAPLLSRSTPLMAALKRVLLAEASTFHLRTFEGGGDQFLTSEASAREGARLRQLDFHGRQDGFCNISFEE